MRSTKPNWPVHCLVSQLLTLVVLKIRLSQEQAGHHAKMCFKKRKLQKKPKKNQFYCNQQSTKQNWGWIDINIPLITPIISGCGIADFI